MLLIDIKNLFAKELSTLYTPSECAELFSIFTEKTLGLNKICLRNSLNTEINTNHQKEFSLYISTLKTGKPYQQILGEVLFYGNNFFIDENVLIPRPETEELVHLIVTQLTDKKQEKLKILDIGTGSGCIPISLAKHFPNAEITSIDISENALKIAKKNADFHQVKVNFVHKDYLSSTLEGKYDMIVSNPPYISTDETNEIPFSVRNFEPNIALFAPKNHALAFYEKIAQDCKKHLHKNGYLFLEINQKLGQETLDLYLPFLPKVQLLKDLSGNNRFIMNY